MNELELKRGLRALATPATPEVDLWPAIAARIGARPRAARRWPRALAAALVGALALGVALRGGERAVPLAQVRQPAGPSTLVAEAQGMRTGTEAALQAPFGSALEAQRLLAASSPDVRAAFAELDAADRQLADALATAPDSTLIFDLLRRSQERRARLVRELALG